MSVRAISVASDGSIKKVIVGDPTMLAINVEGGDLLFQLTEDDGGFIDDAVLVVSETGSIAAKPGYEGPVFIPSHNLELVAV